MATLLVVDDELDTLTVLEILLSMEGYRVVTARDGEKALEKLEHDPPDLIITDLMMPGMDGLELSRRVRKHPQTAKTPIILSTAASARVTEQDDPLFDVVLQKPVDIDVLLGAIRSLLDRSGGGRRSESPRQRR